MVGYDSGQKEGWIGARYCGLNHKYRYSLTVTMTMQITMRFEWKTQTFCVIQLKPKVAYHRCKSSFEDV